MIRGKYLSSVDNISSVLALREAILSAADPESRRDDHDDMCFYALALDENENPVGTGRLYLDEDGMFRLGTICVLESARGRGYGDLIARMLLYRALDMNAPSVHALCPVEGVAFMMRYGMKPEGVMQTVNGINYRELSSAIDALNLEGACHSGKCKGCSKENCGECADE